LQGDQVPLLMQRLAQARLEAQHAQLESAALRCRLQEETELRQDLERELEDTAAAAQELWESMQVRLGWGAAKANGACSAALLAGCMVRWAGGVALCSKTSCYLASKCTALASSAHP
jgi:hypothetical protein